MLRARWLQLSPSLTISKLREQMHLPSSIKLPGAALPSSLQRQWSENKQIAHLRARVLDPAMSIVGARSNRLAKVIALLLVLLIPLGVVFFPRHHSVQIVVPPENVIELPHNQKPFRGDGDFIRKTMVTEIDGAFRPQAIQAVCQSKEWIPGLVVKCKPAYGGIANVRNSFMDCLRFAIEAGAGFVAPTVMLRADDNLTVLHTEDIRPFTHFFDITYFAAALSIACPQMQFYPDASHVPQNAAELNLSAVQFDQNVLRWGHEIPAPEKWRGRFEEWMNGAIEYFPSEEQPVVVNLEIEPILAWPVEYDSWEFYLTFGRLFRFREDIRMLAASVMYSMSRKHNMKLSGDEIGIVNGTFYGAHLRTAADAQAEKWQDYEGQSTQYLEAAVNADLKVMYVASGSKPDIKRLRIEALEKHGIHVESKTALLSVQQRRELEELTWDQQGLVDFEVLLRSSLFGGISTSSFAWTIAFRRHVVAAYAGIGGDYLKKDQTFVDEYSTVFGIPGDWSFFPEGLWP